MGFCRVDQVNLRGLGSDHRSGSIIFQDHDDIESIDFGVVSGPDHLVFVDHYLPEIAGTSARRPRYWKFVLTP